MCVCVCVCVSFCFITKWISYTYTYIPYLLPLASPSLPPYHTPLGGHKAPSWSPCAMWLLPTSYLFHICSVYMSMPLSHFVPAYPSPALCPQVHSLRLCLYSCPAPRFIRTFFFFRFHIYVLADSICFSLSDLLHSVGQTLGLFDLPFPLRPGNHWSVYSLCSFVFTRKPNSLNHTACAYSDWLL